MNSIEAILNAHINNEKGTRYFNYSLESIIQTLTAMENPQNTFKSFHVAGTNGKGSTTKMIYLLIKHMGYTCGLYTSPHLESVNERICADAPISDNELLKALIKIQSVENSSSLTYFDLLTAAAFIFFSEKKLNYAAIECGLGGRMDSTNVVNPLCSIITTISMDHANILGETITKIAAEKSGIIKPKTPVVTGASDHALEVVIQKCIKSKSPTSVLGRDFTVENIRDFNGKISFDFKSRFLNLKHILINTYGIFQCSNFALALESILMSGMKPDESSIYKSAADFHLPARFEKGCDLPEIYFDPAHNPEAITSLVEILRNNFKKNIKIFFSCMSDKDYDAIKNRLLTITSDICYINLSDERGKKGNGEFHEFPEDDVCSICEELTEDGINVFTGTFRLYPVFKKICKNLREVK